MREISNRERGIDRKKERERIGGCERAGKRKDERRKERRTHLPSEIRLFTQNLLICVQLG
jgi:hypothetical protein